MSILQKQKQSGAGLIEVLVSLLILAVGLLGVLSLQANGLNSNQRAVFATEAQLLAQDMADRILAFGSGDSTNSPGGGLNSNLYNGIDVSKVVAPATVTVPSCAGGCDGGATLAFDTADWQSALSDSSLPRGRATVALADPYYTISVMWDADRTGVGAVTCLADNSNCFQMQVRVALAP